MRSTFKLRRTGVLTLLLTAFGFPEVFSQTLSLQEALEKALTSNPRITQMVASHKELQAQVRSRRGLYDWGVQAAANYSRVDQPRVIIFQPSRIKTTSYDLGLDKLFPSQTYLGFTLQTIRTHDNTPPPFNLFNRRYESRFDAVLEQELLRGFIGAPESLQLKADQKRLEANAHQIRWEVEVLLMEVADMYWSLWRDIRLHQVSEQLEKEAEALHQETTRLLRSGLREQDEILQAEASWLERREDTLRAAANAHNSWVRLRSELDPQTDNLPSPHEIPSLSDPAWDQSPGYEEALRRAYSRRPDLRAVEIRKTLYDELRISQRFSGLPSVKAVGGYSLLSLDTSFDESLSQLERSRYPGWNIGMALSHRFGQNQSRAVMDQAEALHLSASARYDELARRIERDLRETLRRRETDAALLDLAIRIDSNHEKIEAATARKYRLGRISMQELVAVQAARRNAKLKRQASEAAMVMSENAVRLLTGSFLSSFNLRSADLPGGAPEPAP